MIQLPEGFNASALVADLFAFGVPIAGLLAAVVAYKVIRNALGQIGGR